MRRNEPRHLGVALAALALGCSSSDDVIAVLEAPAPPQAAIQVFNVRAGQAPGTAFVHPAPPPRIEDSVFVSGVPGDVDGESAEPWPLDPPLAAFFHPASLTGEPVLVEVGGLAAEALRNLGRAYGLDEAGAAANVVVEDGAGDRYDVSIWEHE